MVPGDLGMRSYLVDYRLDMSSMKTPNIIVGILRPLASIDELFLGLLMVSIEGGLGAVHVGLDLGGVNSFISLIDMRMGILMVRILGFDRGSLDGGLGNVDIVLLALIIKRTTVLIDIGHSVGFIVLLALIIERTTVLIDIWLSVGFVSLANLYDNRLGIRMKPALNSSNTVADKVRLGVGEGGADKEEGVAEEEQEHSSDQTSQ